MYVAFSTSFTIKPSSHKKGEEIFFDSKINQIYGDNKQPEAPPGALIFQLVEDTAKEVREKAYLLIKRAKEIDPKLSHEPSEIKNLPVVKT